LNKFEREVLEKQRFQALDWVLHATPARWWGTHKGSFEDWHECMGMMHLRFGKPRVQLIDKYNGQDDPRMNLAKWTQAYGEKPQPEWVHLFCHTLDVIPMYWYIETELRHMIGEWDVLCEGFVMTFSFEDEWDSIDEALQEVKVAIFMIPQESVESIQLEWATQLSCALECYNVIAEEEDKDPWKINIPKTEGHREVQGPQIENPDIIAPVKTK